MSSAAQPSDRAAVAIVLVNWNGWQHTVECLDSLLAQGYPDFHVFVVDNDSRDDSVGHIASWCAQPRAERSWRDLGTLNVGRVTSASSGAPLECRVVDRPADPLPPPPPGCRVTVIRSGGNLGFAGGCNVGLRAAGVDAFDFFWLLNTDTVVARDALHELIRRAKQSPEIGLLGSTVRYYDRPHIVQAMAGARLNQTNAISRHIGEGSHVSQTPDDSRVVERELAYVFGASMLVTREFVLAVGLMQEDYFLYYEELDWAMRARGRFGLGYAPRSHVFHKSGGSSSKVMPAFTARYYYRNRIRFMSRYFPQHIAGTRWRLLKDALMFARHAKWDLVGIVVSVWWHARPIARAARLNIGSTQLI